LTIFIVVSSFVDSLSGGSFYEKAGGTTVIGDVTVL
jgi:hypothetical protein